MRRIFQATAVATAGLVVATTGSAVAAPSPSAAAAGWLSSQVRSGLIYNAQYQLNDYGLTADTALALHHLGGHKAVLTKVEKALAANVDGWVRGGTSTDLYAGSVAKAAVLAETLGANPKKFGGENLLALLESTVAKSGATAGRIQDVSSYGDYANTVGQALAAQALAVAAPAKAGPVIGYLLEQQCSAGYFRLYFADRTAPQTCDAGDATASAPDPDATSEALLSLQALPKQTAKVKKAEKKAVRWLRKQQQANGSFKGGASTGGANANSTGLAAAALAGAGECAQARKAARWVKRLQVGPITGAPIPFTGAIAYDAAAKAAGLTVDTQDQWRRASAQAAPALRFLSAANCG